MTNITVSLTDEALKIIDEIAGKYYQGRRSPAIDYIAKEWGEKKDE